MRLYIADIESVSTDDVALLSPERAAKAERLVSAEEKRRSIAAGLLLKKYLGNIEIHYNDFGKPVCDSVCFNLSHSGRYALLGISDYEIGCDIEKHKLLGFTRLGKMVFCENEMLALSRAVDKMSEFFRLWTKKESLLKCIGQGFHLSPKSVDVSSDAVGVNGKIYHLKSFCFSDYTISVCSAEDEEISLSFVPDLTLSPDKKLL